MNQSDLCDVCGKEPVTATAAMPGIAVTFGYCKGCLKAGAHPYPMVVANTALMGGMENAHPGWQQLVDDTLARLGRTREEFYASVEADMQGFAEAEARANEEFAATEEGQPCWRMHPAGCDCVPCRMYARERASEEASDAHFDDQAWRLP